MKLIFKFSTPAKLLVFVFAVLFRISSTYSQCGFQATCPNTNYLNFGMGSNSDRNTIEYDNFCSSYHSTVVRTANGTYKTWGEGLANNGIANVLAPIEINSTNYPALTGQILKAHLASIRSGTAQGIVLTSTGLFAWGVEGTIIHQNITTSNTFQKITVGGNAQGLPAGVAPTDVKMIFTTYKTMVITTCSGDVWVLTHQGENTGTGLTGALSAANAVLWYKVTTSAAGNPALANVVAVRGNQNTMFALTTTGELYTWGTETYLGNNSAIGSRNRATLMTNPNGNSIKMIGVTRDQSNLKPTYYVLNTDGNLYSVGGNNFRQIGDWSATDRLSWVQPRYTSLTGPVMNNIRWVSPNEHDHAFAAVNVLTADSTNYNWGESNGLMLGRAAAGAANPAIPDGITAANKILAVETGGHTSMLVKKCEDYFGYVGHRINGSMGDGTANTTNEASYTFATAVVFICGATTVDVSVTGTPTLSPGGLYCNGTTIDVTADPTGGVFSVTGPASLSGTNLTFTGTGSNTVNLLYTVPTPGCPGSATATVVFETEDCLLPPTVNVSSPNCSTPGIATITNYDPALTYTFTPSGPIVGAGGVISSMTVGTSYTLTSTNASSFTSDPSASFSITAQLTVPSTPTISTVAATCSAVGTATITNYNAAQTYTFTPSGPTAGAAGVISGMTAGTSYTVTTTNASTCTSVSSASFSIAAQLTTPSAPTVSTVAATCSASGTATITNYNAAQTYTFTPSGPTAGAAGVISGMTAGTSYTVTTTNASTCTSVSSASFSIAAQLTTPSAPTVSTVAATCSAAGTATITNYNAAQTYTFTPSGPTAGAAGVISGMTAGTSYTVTTTNASTCTSVSSASFSIAAQLTTPSAPTVSTVAATCSAAGTATITNYNAAQTYTFTPSGPTAGAAGAISGMTAGTSYTVTTTNASTCTSVSSASFSIAAQLTTPSAPTVSTVAATCSASGTATITNYNAAQTYTFTPSGPIAGAAGVISGMTAGTSYTVTTTNASTCTSVSSASFSIAAQLTTPSAPTVSTVAATCSASGTATITNYNAVQTYTFTPSGPTAGAAGVISGMTAGTSYTVTTTNASTCTSVSSASFSIAAQLTTPSAPTVSTVAATCSASGTATITNYNAAQTYTFTPSGPTAGAAGVISGMTAGTSYTVTTTNASTCTSVSSASFSIAAQLTTPSAPTVSTVAATCSASGTATITNYNAAQTYTFTPSGPTAGAAGAISGMTAGTSYTVTTTNASTCTSVSSASFSIAAQLTTPSAPTVSTVAATCSAAGTATITNYNAAQTYTFTPIGPTAGAAGVISGMTAGTSYTVTTTNASTCTSVSSASFNIAIPLCNPTANNDSTSTNEEQPVIVSTIQSNDTDLDGNVVTSTIDLDPSTPGQQTTLTTAEGTWVLNTTTGNVTFTPVTNYNGTATITYTIEDNVGLTSNTANIIVTVLPVNDSPVVDNDSNTISEDGGPATGDLTDSGDSDPDGTPLTVETTPVSGPSNGTITINADGTYSYTPNAGFNGQDTIIVSVCDNGLPLPAICVNDTLIITVTPVNDSPVVDNDSNTISEDGGPATGDLTDAGDSDPDGTPLTVDITPVSGSSNGTITINADGTYSYTPNAGFNGQDTIIVSVCDNGLPLPAICVNDTLIITVTPVNDSPVVDNDSNTISEDGGPATGDLTDSGDSDPDGTPLTVETTPVSGPSNGTITINADGTYSYTPNAGFNGQDTIIVSVCDNGLPLPAICVNDTLIITVTPVNDSPVVDNDSNTISEDGGPATGDLTDAGDSDPDGTPLTVDTTPVSGPSNGTITINADGTYSYTPNAGFNGQDTIIVSVCDNGLPLPAICVNDTLIITVTPVNDSPVVDNDSNTISEDGGPATGDLTDSGDSDPDGTPLTVETTPVSGPSNGTITINADGTYSYTPNAGFNGQDTIIVSVCDNGLPLPAICVNDTLVITVTPINDAPNAVADNASTYENSSVVISVTNNDTDTDGNIDVTTVTIVDSTSNGTVSVDPITGAITYTPNAGFIGTDTLIYQVCDDGIPLPGMCDTAIVIITVLSCETDLTADCDGDGVTNGEEVDPDGDGTPGPNGTDPSDPCSFDVANQDLGAVSQAWLDADCDGDGATNGEEVDPDGDGTPGPNGTDPSDPCSYDVANQDLGTVSQAWLDADCDGDGVTNGEEVDPDGDGTPGPNGTDPSDPCSYDVANQDLGSVSQAWLDADCDGDGLSNGEEVTGGSDPNDPCDPNSTLPGCSSGVDVPEAFTPDGDGTNETFVITGIENYPSNKLIVLNRWGNEVFYAESYSNTWNGIANRGIKVGDGLLPTATYYYILDLYGDGQQIIKGYVYIKR